MAGKAKRSIIIEILGDAKNYAKSAKQAESATSSFEKKVDAVGKAIAGAYMVKKIVDFGVASVKAASEDAAAQTVLATTLRNTTKATDDQIASVEDWITQTSHATGVLDDSLRPALADLLRVTKDQTKAQGLLSLAMDVSRGTGKDLETVSAAIAKAYSGNATALNKLVPGLKQAGEGTLSFADAQARLNQQFGGQAAAYAETAQGRLERLNAQYADMQETIGTALMPVMEQLVGVVTEIFGWFNSLDPSTQQLITTLGLLAGGLYIGATAFNAVADAVKTLGISTQSTMPWLAAIGVVVGGLLAISGSWEDSNAALEQRTESVAQALKNEIEQIVELERASGRATTATSAIELAQLALSNALTGSDEKGKETSEALGALGFQAADAAEMIGLLGGITSETASTTLEFMGANQKAVRQMFIAQGYSADLATELSFLAAQGRYTGTEIYDLANVTAGWTDEERDAAIAANALGQAARGVDVPGIASDYLNAEVATNAWREQLVATAEANAGTTRNAADANLVLDEYMLLLIGLTPEQEKLYNGATDTSDALDGVATSASTAAASGDTLTKAISESRDVLSESAQAANDLKSAIDELFAPTMNFEEANRKLKDGTQELIDHFTMLDDKGNQLSTTLDINTQRGRENRAEVQNQTEAILDFGVAMVGQGKSTEEAAAYMNELTDQMVDQLVMTGVNREEAEAYIATLGMTPENIETTVKIAEIDKSKRELEDMLGQLDEIDAGAKAEIEAQIANGDLETARTNIKKWADANGVTLKVGVAGSGTISVKPSGGNGSWIMKAYAKGGNPMAGETALVGEKGPELVTFGHNSTVHPADETRRILAAGGGRNGGGEQYHVHIAAGAVVSDRELTEMIAEGLSTAARRTGSDVTTRRRAPI